MDPDDNQRPRRGGSDFMGPYVGGTPLDENYRLLTTEESFKCALQLRNAKTLLGIESDLRKALATSTILKYDGKLKLGETESSAKELDKEEFLLAVDEAIMSYGLQSFFYLPNKEGNMTYLAEEPHLFTIEQVMDEHASRLNQPAPEVDDNDIETVTSISSRFRCYDKFEKFDISLSRRVLETLLSQDIKATIRIKYGHLSNFKSLPGQVLFMMALDVSNASAIQDIDEATLAFKTLALSTYPGENIVDFATEAQRLIKIMGTGYALPYKTGSALLSKVEKTSSTYFNQQVFRYQSQVKIMERAIGPLVDPKSIVRHPDYPTYGPLGLCALIQEEYGELKRSNEWPALTSTLPEGNYSGPPSGRNSLGRRCYKCNSEFHLANDPICPENSSTRTDEGENGTNSGTTNESSRSSSSPSTQSSSGSGPNNSPLLPAVSGSASAPASIWKYIHPADKNQKLDVNGKTYYFCAKCVCHHTSKTGFYNTTHTTSQHTPGLGRRRNQTDSTPSAQGNLTPIQVDPPPIKKAVSFKDKDTDLPPDEDPDTLHFEGAFHTDAIDDGIWMSEVNKNEGDATTPTERPVLHPSVGNSDEWTVADSNLGSNLGSIVQVPVIIGLSFFHVDVGNDLFDLDTPIILQGCMTLTEYNLRKSNADPSQICEELMIEATKDVDEKVELKPKTTSTYFPTYFDAIDYLIKTDYPSPSPDLFFDPLNLDEKHLPTSTTTSESHTTSSLNLRNSVTPATLPTDVPIISTNEETSLTTITSQTKLPTIPLSFKANVGTKVETNPILPSTLSTSIYALHYYNFLFNFKSTLSYYATKLIQSVIKIWTVFFTFNLFITAITWDSIDIFFSTTPSTISRKMQRRRSFHPRSSRFQWSYPKRWMILSCFRANTNFTHSIHPTSAIIQSLSSTYSRMHLFGNLFESSPKTLYDYNHWRYNNLPTLTTLNTPNKSTDNLFDLPTKLEGDDTLDNLNYFDSHPSQSSLDSKILQLDFFTASDERTHTHLPFFNFATSTASNTTIDYGKTDLDQLSPYAFNACTMGSVDLHPPTSPSGFPVIFDTGASLAISPNKGDFSGKIEMFPYDRYLGGMAEGMKIEGVGNIKWSFRSKDGIITLHSRCYYVPDAKARLISPQRLFNEEQGITGQYITKEKHSTLTFDNVGSIDIQYDERSHLPMAIAKNLHSEGAQANLCILNDANQNLTPSQKLLLLWHARFGHKNFPAVQRLFRSIPFLSEKYMRASRCVIPRCEVCELAKGHRKPTKGNKQSTNKLTDGAIKGGDLRPGASISVDHFESRVKGRTRQSYGSSSADQYVGGCIFVDHMSNYIHIEPQLGFSSSETIRAKQNFEKLSLDNGILIDSYLADNGVFKANAFVTHIRDHNQKLRFCGVNAHHQNATAERNIRTISECARSLLLHSSLRWKSGIKSDLWPFAVAYASYLYNHLPNEHGLAPIDLFTGVQSPRHKLKDIHVWGAPVYVLHPTLQQGRKIPRWEPRARRGVFLGFSPDHASDVPLILNLSTGSISPQYHVVFDDEFSTVSSIAPEETPPSFWNEIDLLDHVHRIPLDPDSNIDLQNEWLTPAEVEERSRSQSRQRVLRQSSSSGPDIPIPVTGSSILNDTTANDPSLPTAAPLSESPISLSATPNSVPKATPISPTVSPTPPSSPRRSSRLALPRRSNRLNKGQHETRFINQAFLSSICDETRSNYHRSLAYTASLETDLTTGEDNCIDARAYAAKHRTSDPDNPTYNEALTGVHASEYESAMVKEINQLMLQKTWTPISREKVPLDKNNKVRPILKGTWAFKLKRLPDGTPLKFKARYCVRGDLQREGVDYFETYAPVVQWSTVRLLLTLILSNNWTTKQVDYTNAFAQAELNEEVYIQPPRGFVRKDKKNMVLKLLKSLYGLKQAPKTFFDKLKAGLLERGFTQSILDPCLFMKENMMCVIYVDDTIIAGPDSKEIDKLITSLGVAKEEQRHTFELRDEGEVGDFLGIRIEKGANNSFVLTQSGLINKVLKEASMTDCNSSPTPANTTPLHIDKNGDELNESWEYPTIIGMLMYLATNSRPDIAFAVHQCARFTHAPKASHATAVKRILRYLQGTKDKGMTLTPTTDMNVNCYVDADFAGTWSVEDDQEPVSVKSRSGHLITFMGCPLLWSSKMQTQIALSTMEAEYIALSNSMRDLIAVREVLKEILCPVFKPSDNKSQPTYATISRSFNKPDNHQKILPKSIVYEDNTACLKFATMPKMSPRTKHIAIPYHFFRSKVEELEIKVVGINTENQVADQFTKGLAQDKFVRDRKALMGW